MGQILHGSATTTAAVRRAIQHSQESLMVLAKEQCPKVGDGMIGWHIMAVFTCRDSRREKDMPHERRYDFAVH